MNMVSARLRCGLPALLAAFSCASAGFFVGCSGDEQPLDPAKVEHLQQIQQAYMKAAQDMRRPPQDREELKNYLPADVNMDELFRSEIDGQEYVIIWGTDPFTPPDLFSSPEPKPIVIGYEKEGKDGQRYVFLANGVVQMDDARFAQANFPPGHNP